jgi:hypothetical protein
MCAHQGAFVHLDEMPKTAETASGEFDISSLGPTLFMAKYQHEPNTNQRVRSHLTNCPYLSNICSASM